MNINTFLLICGISVFIAVVVYLIIYLSSKNTKKYKTLDLGTKEINLSEQIINPIFLNNIQLNPKEVPYNQPLPTDNFTIFGVQDQQTLNKKIYTLMNLFSPVYNFHSDEKFYPGTFDSCNNITLNKLIDSSKNIYTKVSDVNSVFDLFNIGNKSNDITNNIQIQDNHIVTNCKDTDYILSFTQQKNPNYGSTNTEYLNQVKKDIVNNYANIAGDLYNPYFEQTCNTYYHKGCPGGPILWSDKTIFKDNQEFANLVLEENKKINWRPNPQICTIMHKPVVRNNKVQLDKNNNQLFVTDFIYTSYFIGNNYNFTTVVVRFLSSDLKNDIYSSNPPMPFRFYLGSKNGGQWYLPKNLLFRKLNELCVNPTNNSKDCKVLNTNPIISTPSSNGNPNDLGRNSISKTHLIVYISRDSHNLYYNSNPPNKSINDSIGGGVCWQPPVIFLDRPQTIDAWNTITSLTDNYFSSYYSPKIPEIDTILNTENNLTNFFAYFSFFNNSGYAYKPEDISSLRNFATKISPVVTNTNFMVSFTNYVNSPFFGFGTPYLYFTGQCSVNLLQFTSLYSLNSYIFIEASCLPLSVDDKKQQFSNSCGYVAGSPTNNLYLYLGNDLPKPFMDNNINYIKGIYSNSVCDPNNYQENILNSKFQPICNQTTKRLTGKVKAITGISIVDKPINYKSSINKFKSSFKVQASSIETSIPDIYPEFNTYTDDSISLLSDNNKKTINDFFTENNLSTLLTSSDNLLKPKKYNKNKYGIALTGKTYYSAMGMCALFKYIFDTRKTSDQNIKYSITNFFTKFDIISTVCAGTWFWSIFSFVLSNKPDINISNLLGDGDDPFVNGDFIGNRFIENYSYLASFAIISEGKSTIDRYWGLILGKYLLEYYKLNDDLPISLNLFHDQQIKTEYCKSVTKTLVYDTYNILPFWISNATLKFDYVGVDYPNLLINLTPLYSGMPITYKAKSNETLNQIGGVLIDTYAFGNTPAPPIPFPKDYNPLNQNTIPGTDIQNPVKPETKPFILTNDLTTLTNLTKFGKSILPNNWYFNLIKNSSFFGTNINTTYLRDVIAMSTDKNLNTTWPSIDIDSISDSITNNSISGNSIQSIYTRGNQFISNAANSVVSGFTQQLYANISNTLNVFEYSNLLWGTLRPQTACKREDCTKFCLPKNGIIAGTCIPSFTSCTQSCFDKGLLPDINDLLPTEVPTNKYVTQLSYINTNDNNADPSGIISLISRGVYNILFFVYPENDINTNDRYLLPLFNDKSIYKIFDDNSGYGRIKTQSNQTDFSYKIYKPVKMICFI